jgi:cyclohexanone monooxygenase
MAGFPNLFNLFGPGSTSAFTNVIVAIEHQVECIGHLDHHRLATLEATPEAEADYIAHVNTVAARTIYLNCNSWYLGANIPGKPRMFMPLFGFPAYVQRCADVARQGYAGFRMT